MIELLDVCYVRLGTKDIQTSTDFATRILGLEVSESSRNSRHLRSDERGHTLYYHDGDPNDHVVGFEISSNDDLDSAAATLEAIGNEVYRGTRDECDSRHVRDFISFREPSGLKIELVVRPEVLGKRHFQAATLAFPVSATSGFSARIASAMNSFGHRCVMRASATVSVTFLFARERDSPHAGPCPLTTRWSSAHQSPGGFHR